jgi:hypothetical protein
MMVSFICASTFFKYPKKPYFKRLGIRVLAKHGRGCHVAILYHRFILQTGARGPSAGAGLHGHVETL